MSARTDASDDYNRWWNIQFVTGDETVKGRRPRVSPDGHLLVVEEMFDNLPGTVKDCREFVLSNVITWTEER